MILNLVTFIMDTWSNIAEHYHHFVDSSGDKLRTELLYPTLIELAAPLEAKNVLDIGCGNGFFAYKLAQKGAFIQAFDNADMISIAKQHFPHKNITYAVQDAEEKLAFSDHQFDVVTANLVLMDMPEINNILQESKRVAKPEGKIIFSILHPCFTPPVGKFRRGLRGRINLKHAYFHLKDYFNAPLISKKQSFGPNIPATNYYHRTLSEYAHLFRKNNLKIEDIFEPKPSRIFLEKYPHFFHAEKISIFCIFVLHV